MNFFENPLVFLNVRKMGAPDAGGRGPRGAGGGKMCFYLKVLVVFGPKISLIKEKKKRALRARARARDFFFFKKIENLKIIFFF